MRNPQFCKEASDALDILLRNFRIQVPDQPKKSEQKEVKIYIYGNDFREGMDYERIFDAIHTLKKEGIRLQEYDPDNIRPELEECGPRHTEYAEVILPINFEEIYKRLCDEYGNYSNDVLISKLVGLEQEKTLNEPHDNQLESRPDIFDKTNKKESVDIAIPLQIKLLQKDGRGGYLYDGKKIIMSEATIYFKVLDALYSNSNQDGFSSYEGIESYLIKSGEKESENEKQRNTRIKNAISEQQGLFRFAKVGGDRLKNKTLDGGVLIEILRGKGLKLNNPNI